ncbi:MAG: hypothetical protein COV67_03925 [Nitrospinae bacterium CG11_big_fil_rev_8_21_14_0_20_56_8]|nr:MAG: hypothetical protein COV67_03925 [Nitrospinae bacterium CG11_big_fil_rev_8_21_14_0_20_56_8]
MNESFQRRLDKELNRLREDNRFRQTRLYRECRLDLSSNDYFQLRYHPAVQEAVLRATRQQGTGSGASPLLSGFHESHERLLRGLMEWKQKPAGMLFNTGFMANQALLTHLPQKNDLVLADRLVHHSMAQALGRGSFRFMRYPHLDLDRLEELLDNHHKEYDTVFVVTESVFSMDGDFPNLGRLAELRTHYGFVLILDEAHGTGVYGPTGAGLAQEAGILDQVDILVGTLGKALASMGAYVLTHSQTIVDYLTNMAGEYIFSTFLPPAQAECALEAMRILQNAAEERSALRERSIWFRERLHDCGFSVPGLDSPIIPIILGESAEAVRVRDRFWDQRILVGAVRPPTVPQGTARLRLSLHSRVTERELEEVLTLLNEFRKI